MISHMESAATDTQGAAAYIKDKTGVAVSARTLEGHRSRGLGPRYLRIAGRVAYRFEDLDAHIDSCVVEPSEVRTNVG